MRKSTLRTIGAVIGVTAAAATVLTGCSSTGSGDTASGGKVTLNYFNWDGGLQAVVDEWNKANPDIQGNLSKPSGTG